MHEPDWYASEPSLGRLWVADLQRLKRRAKTRLLLIFALTFLLTGAAARKLRARGHSYESSVFLAIDESSLSRGRNSIPGRELMEYVGKVLITDQGLADLAKRRNLHPLRRKFGDEYAVAELRMQFELEAIQNDYAERRVLNQARTAHVQLTVYDATPEEATLLANDIAEIAVSTAAERNGREARLLTQEVERVIAGLRAKLGELERALAQANHDLQEARLRGDDAEIAERTNRFVRAEQLWRRADVELERVSRSAVVESSAEALQEAGLGIKVSIMDRKNAGALVDQRFSIGVAVTCVFFGGLVAFSLLVGAFDSRLHEPEDVARLGLPVLGQVPNFPGQGTGALRQRGVPRHRVPSFLRWRRS
ncbi:MAG: hypothetical protein R3B48_11945 [Kofleriaceae bacterium]